MDDQIIVALLTAAFLIIRGDAGDDKSDATAGT